MTNRRNYLVTLVTGFGNTGISLVLGLISAPVGLRYWGVEKYGLWAVITSVMVYLNVSNFGLASAASILVAKSLVREDKLLILRRAFFLLCGACLVGAMAFGGLFMAFPNWITLLGNIPVHLEREAILSCVIIAAGFFFNMPFTILTAGLLGFQKAYIENVFTGLSTILNFLALILTVVLKGSLVTLALAYAGATLSVIVAKSVTVLLAFGSRASLKAFSGPLRSDNPDCSYRRLSITGFRFFMIWAAAVLVWNTDNFVIARLLGIRDVTPYSITFKFYSFLFSTIFIVNNSLTPLMGREFGRGNFTWINVNYRRMLTVTAALGGLTLIGGLLFSQDAIVLWTGREGFAGIGVVLGLGVYSFLLSMVNLNANLINSFNYIKGTPILAFAEGFVKIGASILLCRLIGLEGIAWGTVAGSLLVPTWVLPILLRKRSNRLIEYPVTDLLRSVACSLVPCVLEGLAIKALVSGPVIARVLSALVLVQYCVTVFFCTPKDIRQVAIHVLSRAAQRFMGSEEPR